MINMKEVLLKWFINVLTKKTFGANTSGGAVKSENMSNQ